MTWESDPKVLEALAQIAAMPQFKVVAAALRGQADDAVNMILNSGAELRPYALGELAGKARAFREILSVATSAPEILGRIQERRSK